MSEQVPVHDWQRLNPLMLLVHPVNEIIRFFPLVIGAFFFGSSMGSGGGRWQLIGVAIPIALGLGRFLTTKYRITPTQIELHRGLLARRVLTAPLDRVRSIELTASPIHRILGLSTIQIGTGSAARVSEEKLALDALSTADARALRTALLRRSEVVAEPTGGADETTALPAEQVLLTLDPRWARYAPLTSSGLVIGATIMAVVSQFGESLSLDEVEDRLPDLGVPFVVVAVLGLLLGLAAFALLAVAGYLVTNWGFTLATDPSRRSYDVSRGLFTTKETSLETERIRGLELHEPLTLRLAGAARLNAIATGLGLLQNGGVSPMVPVAPRAVVDDTATRILLDPSPVSGRLVGHGPIARRRRYTRALLGTLPLLVALVAGPVVLDGFTWLWLLAPVLVVAAVALARDRAARLGHALTPRFLVVRSGSVTGRRDILERIGIIGWNLRQSFFQRRLGLVDVVATTSAGKQAFTAYDVPEHLAIALADEAVPGLVAQFRSAS